MKRLFLIVCLMSVCLLCTNCVTVGSNAKVDPERFGRLTTVAYLATKDKMDEDHVEAVKTVYGVFDAILSGEMDETEEFKAILLAKLAEEVGEDNPEVVMIVNEIVDMYWGELVDRYGKVLEDYKTQISILKSFHKGIEAALEDYEFMNK
jgi:hypothetical protein